MYQEPIFDELTLTITPDFPHLTELYGFHAAAVRAWGQGPIAGPLIFPTAEPVHVITDASPLVASMRDRLKAALTQPKPTTGLGILLPGRGR